MDEHYSGVFAHPSFFNTKSELENKGYCYYSFSAFEKKYAEKYFLNLF
jgi:hypothetical protein